jgi:hypothetical protein
MESDQSERRRAALIHIEPPILVCKRFRETGENVQKK